jgi:hypothetical protein
MEIEMKCKYSLIGIVSILILVTGCAVTDIDKTADFSSYRTYRWGTSEVTVTNPIYNSGLISKNIKSTVDQELAKRGFRKDSTAADVVVSFHTYTEKKEETSRPAIQPFGFYPFGFFAYRFFPYGYGLPSGWANTPSTRTYTEGTLIIDITDSRSNALVWRGSVSGNVDSISQLQKQIRKGIRAILKKYPVSPTDPLPKLNDEDVVS